MITDLVKETRMADLIDILRDASKAYYSPVQGEDIVLTDAQYDRYLKELRDLEIETGIKLPGSPTILVGFAEQEEAKIKHPVPILSLKDTKSVDDLLHFIDDHEALLSWKLDGISIVLTYSNGALLRAVSRGDGTYGKDITKNVRLMQDVPIDINNRNTLIIRGEGCLSLKDFDQLQQTKEGEKYSNPRSMASGLINGTKTTNVLLRHMHFIVHSVILLDRYACDTKSRQLTYLQTLNFNIVPFIKVLNFEVIPAIEKYTKEVENYDFPVDGLVLTLNDIAYSESLGSTARYPRGSMAFKWPDEMVLTQVTGVKWSVSRTGLITPVVLLRPVKLEGTIVKQANLHNLKFFEELSLGIGDTVKVFKANKIIPEIYDNLTRSRTLRYPETCPVCGSETTVIANTQTRKLYCFMCANHE